ncbi:CocE/NonD family hydrolase C-terminal non-catalytic domain-containing protein [Devosia albogilva]|uniref:CocE/NonD family hydrolase C-terminal non-catalytic domain-containing protein n=1 Tax=Devosia albogilva TaxID=429726 RepID=A0ABW5QPM5_9HYPH
MTIRLGHISHLFRRGTRLRLQVASSNFPRLDRNPQSGSAPETASIADFTAATHTIHGGSGCTSRLVLQTVLRPFPQIHGPT